MLKMNKDEIKKRKNLYISRIRKRIEEFEKMKDLSDFPEYWDEQIDEANKIISDIDRYNLV